jgi:3-deoxy-manno-octulosonate cytidylyltransferase (CMP-KDO synthetase)
MKIIAVIPALRFDTISSKTDARFGGKTVILRTYEAAINTQLFDDVFCGNGFRFDL